MTKTLLCIGLMLAAAAGAPVQAQQKPPAKPAAPAPPPPKPDSLPKIERDPFISLLGRGEDPTQSAPRAPGLGGLLIGEVTVKGVLRDKSGFIAMLQAPDNKTYNVRVGDRLLDGSVKSINQDKVIFSQDVNDPLSLVKQREVPKLVRQAEGRG
jgi:hypothetical protein